MFLTNKISNKELLNIRNDIFLNKGINSLKTNGFIKSPFSTAWNGKDDLGDFSYEFCRVINSFLEIIFVDIVKGDKSIRIKLNIFELSSNISSIKDLDGLDGLQYHLNPNRNTEMQLRIDDFKGMPLFRTKEHKLKFFNSKSGLKKRVKQLGDLIEEDLNNINHFIERWHEMHVPNLVDLEGNVIKDNTR